MATVQDMMLWGRRFSHVMDELSLKLQERRKTVSEEVSENSPRKSGLPDFKKICPAQTTTILSQSRHSTGIPHHPPVGALYVNIADLHAAIRNLKTVSHPFDFPIETSRSFMFASPKETFTHQDCHYIPYTSFNSRTILDSAMENLKKDIMCARSCIQIQSAFSVKSDNLQSHFASQKLQFGFIDSDTPSSFLQEIVSAKQKLTPCNYRVFGTESYTKRYNFPKELIFDIPKTDLSTSNDFKEIDSGQKDEKPVSVTLNNEDFATRFTVEPRENENKEKSKQSIFSRLKFWKRNGDRNRDITNSKGLTNDAKVKGKKKQVLSRLVCCWHGDRNSPEDT